MKTILEQAKEFMETRGVPRREKDPLDKELEKFSRIVHKILTGKAAEELAIPYDERDQDFIQRYPSFTLSKFLGRGQAGVVFLGEDDNGKPLFAIKVIHLPGAVGRGLPVRRTFLAYQDVLKHINNPYINSYLGWTVVDDEAQVYTHFCNTGSLLDLIDGKGILDIAVIRKYTREILEGLEYLHSHGIVHRYIFFTRDLKPANILTDNGRAKIIDLGSARIQQSCCDDPHQKKMAGTAAYCPPEAIKEKIVHYHAGEDIWGLGCCFYEMVIGKIPWSQCDNPFAIYFTLGNLCDGEDHELITDLINSEKLDKDGVDFARVCMQVDPLKRPTAFELLKHPFLIN
jgi:mitogen-activated protein kinase kinase kinase